MKVTASVKKRSEECILVRRKGKLLSSTRRIRNTSKDKVKLSIYILWQEYLELIYPAIKEGRLG